MAYCRLGSDSDVHLAFTHTGFFEMIVKDPKTGELTDLKKIPDIASVLVKLEYYKQKHFKIPEKVISRLNRELQALIEEERQDPYAQY